MSVLPGRHMCAVPTQTRTEYWIPWNCSYRWLWAAMLVRGTKPDLLQEWPVPLTAEMSLQAHDHAFKHSSSCLIIRSPDTQYWCCKEPTIDGFVCTNPKQKWSSHNKWQVLTCENQRCEEHRKVANGTFRSMPRNIFIRSLSGQKG